jgi:hypothetical protein
MSDRNSDPGPAAGNAPGSGYGLPNQTAPLPRQWQLQRGMAPLPPRANANASVQQQFYPAAAGAADWRPTPATRPTERAILVGLWLLVMLTAVAIGLRFLDLSALTVTPTDLAVRPAAAAAAAADAGRAAAYAAVLANDDPMFDDPVPAAAPLPPAPVPVRLAAPTAARPGVGLAASAALAPEKPAKPAPAVIAQAGRPGDACPDALRAMQLCSEKSR